MNKNAILGFLLILLGCSGCFTQSITGMEPMEPWKYSELRALDPSDIANPNQDIIAVYSRDHNEEIQIRVDFLDQQPGDPPYLMIVFEDGSGSSYQLPFGIQAKAPWNYLLVIPPDGQAVLLNGKSELVSASNVIISRDPVLDAIFIHLNKTSLLGWSLKMKIELFSINFASKEMEYDLAGPLRLDSFPPSPGKLSLVFWNPFQSETPAQALRSWDGAHTGPFSLRHGLKSLMDAIDMTGIPIILLDLDKPENLSALDYLGVAQRIQSLKDRGDLILVQPDDSELLDVFPLIVNKVEDANPILDQQPSLTMRRMLLENAIQADKMLLLGGDFSKSPMGNSDIAIQILTYIKNHPWIKPMRDPASFVEWKSPQVGGYDPFIAEIKSKVLLSPKNHIRLIEDQLLSSWTSEATPKLEELRRQYLGQIGHLIAISSWSKDRRAISDCTKDLDWDDQPECFLSSETQAIVIDLQGGYISFAFAYAGENYHQVSGPSYQLALGLSDPITWKVNEGIASDPSIIPGAFADNEWSTQRYVASQVEPGLITIQSNDRKILKTFLLTKDSIQFSYKGLDDEKLWVPLVVDPWVMELPAWGNQYQNALTVDVWEWGILEQIKVIVHSSDPIEVYTFKDSSDVIRFPENPNYAYPAGHYLPFPLALGNITTGGEGAISIRVSH